MRGIALILFTILIPIDSIAETVYVTDQLSLKLRLTPTGDGEVITTLKSGDRLTMLEEQQSFSKVQTQDGKSGWVQSWYVSSEQPATYIVDKVIQENESIKQQLQRANSKLESFDSETLRENEKLKNTVATLSEKIKTLTTEQDELKQEFVAQANKIAKYEFVEKYNINLIILIFFLVSFVIGFWVSRVWTRKQESKRLSGYKLAH
ncbi:MAG: TIGR04211 family SH3 domain-containing protein [Pseudomonadota bacterium]